MSRFSLCSVTTIALASLFLTFGTMAHAQGVPGVDKNKCLAGKTKCVGKLTAGLLKCRELCQKSTKKCGQAQTDCEAKAIEKYDGGDTPEKGCFAKLEAKDDPAKPDSVCTTTGDSGAMEAEAAAAAAELVDRLEGTYAAPACPAPCVDALLQYADHDVTAHVSNQHYQHVCSDTGLSVADGDLGSSPTHGDSIAISEFSGCNVNVADNIFPSIPLNSEEVIACLPLAAFAVRLATGRACDVSAP